MSAADLRARRQQYELEMQIAHPHAERCECGPYGEGYHCARHRYEMRRLDEQIEQYEATR